jgi:phosphoribosyl-AMP cyclohydrolase
MQFMFKKRDNIREVEEGKYLSPKFDKNGLIPVITTDFQTGDILMHSYMNDEALKKTIETKEAHYWSRSRKKIWHKGQVSGFVQIVKEIRIDDDQDSVWLSVDIGSGASCHLVYRSFFYRSIPLGKIKNEEALEMEFKEKEKIFDPKKVYKDEPNPTKL